jgi:uncharacterized membrane protein YphA (DoxX/SURF4 family)
MNPRWTGLAKFSSVFLRLALGISFLSAVADRFGLWGVHRQPNVSWANYARFVDYTAKLNWFLPAAMIPTLAIIAAAAETLFGLLLVLSGKTRITALLSGVLVTTFPLCAHGLAHEQTTRFARSFDFVAGEVMAGHERANGNICSRHAQKFARGLVSNV